MAAPIAELIAACTAAGGLVVATRDYHPATHCSFEGNGGSFPAHCVQGSEGSHFFPPVAAALAQARAARPDAVKVARRGPCE